jgi:thiol-disulfide isomerase/thioredoxin
MHRTDLISPHCVALLCVVLLATVASSRLAAQDIDGIFAQRLAAAAGKIGGEIAITEARAVLAATPGVASADDTRSAPAIEAERWFNTEALTAENLHGKVVLVEFWTFACWNCRNVEPHVRAWHERYASRGLQVVAVHTPELEMERDVDNVRRYLKEHRIDYPVAVDNDFSIWRAFGVRAWPTILLIGRDGRLRYRHVGEGAYDATEAKIRELLAEKPDEQPSPRQP